MKTTARTSEFRPPLAASGTSRPGGRMVVCLVLLMTAGCAPAGGNAQTQPAVEPSQDNAQRLDEKALLTVDELTPPVAAPENDETVGEPHPRAREALEEAERLLEQQDNFAAVRLLERAVGFDPEHPALRRTLGLAYARQRNWAKALENFRRAAQKAPDDLTLQVWLGLLATGQNRHDDAIIAFRRALKCSDAKPSEAPAAEALLRLGQLLHRQGYHTAALECYERLGEWMRDHSDVYVERHTLRDVVLRPELLLTSRGELLLKLNRPGAAADVLDRAFRLDRSQPETVRLLLDSLLADGRGEQAEDVLMDIAAEPAHEAHFVELAGNICHEIGDPELPLQIWRRYRRQGRVHGPLAVELARASQEMGDADAAGVLLSEALETMPGNLAAARELVKIKSQSGDVPGAMALLVDILAGDDGSAEAVRAAVGAVAETDINEDLARDLRRRADTEPDHRRHAAHYVAGVVAERAGLDHLAVEQYRAALDAKDGFLAAADALTDIHLRHRRYDMAERVLAELKDTDSEFFRLYLWGKVALARGRSHAALDSLRNAYELDNTHLPVILLLARAYRNVGQHNQAVQMFRRAINIDPDNVDYYRRLFELHALMNQYTEAEAVVELLRRRTGDNLTADVMTAELHLARGEHDKARQLLESIRTRAPDSFAVELLEVRAAVESETDELDEEDFTRAVRVLSRAVEDAGGDSMAMRLLMQLLRDSHRQAEAVAVWGNLYRKTNEPLISRLYVLSLVNSQQHEHAVNVLDEILAGDPQTDWARHAMLESLQELDRTDEAIERVSRWIDETEEPASRQVFRRALLRIHSETEDYDAAQSMLDDWLRDTRDADTRGALRIEKIRLYGQSGEYDQAVEFVQDALESVSKDLPLKITLLQILNEAEQYETALSLATEWLEDADAETEGLLRHWIIDLYADTEQFDQAEVAAGEWIEQAPDDLRPRAIIVWGFVQAEQFERAGRLVDEWIETRLAEGVSDDEPTDDEILNWCRLTQVRLLLMQDLHTDALEQMESHTWYSHNADAMSMKAICLEQLGRNDEALETLERTHEMAPDDPGIKNNLGYFYADRGIELDKAERLIRGALSDLPGETAFLDSLAWVFYKQGRFHAAARVFEQALEASDEEDGDDETHPVILDHTGDTYWRLGRREDAVRMWRQALTDAERETRVTADVESVLSEAPLKLEAVEEGREPSVAPLGEGVETDTEESAQ